jgi:hypothetical protein
MTLKRGVRAIAASILIDGGICCCDGRNTVEVRGRVWRQALKADRHNRQRLNGIASPTAKHRD